MPSKYLVLLLSLAVLLGGCKKDDPEPDPYEAVVGDWHYAYSVLFRYDAAGTLLQTQKLTITPLLRVPTRISATTIAQYFVPGYRFPGALPYSRQGSQLTITFPADYTGPSTRTISRLTADSLTLDTTTPAAGSGPSTLLKDHFARP